MNGEATRKVQCHFYMDKAEYLRFKIVVRALGYDSISQFLRACARNAIKRVASDMGDRDEVSSSPKWS